MINAYRLFSEARAREIAASLTGWEPGKASTEKATGSTKQNLEIQSSPYLDEIREALKSSQAMVQHFVSKCSPLKFNKYEHGGTYKEHCDAGLMYGIRTDLACTVFLTEGFEGGELVVGSQRVTAKPGVAVLYDCWRPHHVNPVTSGARVCAVGWLQSYIPDDGRRELLNMLHGVTMQMENQEHFAKLGAVHEKLFKMWMRN